LPASAGILPACWCRRRIALGARPSLRQDAEGSRLEARAPLPIHAHGYFRSRGEREAGASQTGTFPGRSLGTSPHGLSPSTHYEKLDYGRCVDPKGSAGILPASAGILPACWCRRRIALGARPSLRQDAEGSRLEACAPLPIHAHGYFRSRGKGRLEPRRLERSQAGAWERVAQTAQRAKN